MQTAYWITILVLVCLLVGVVIWMRTRTSHDKSPNSKTLREATFYRDPDIGEGFGIPLDRPRSREPHTSSTDTSWVSAASSYSSDSGSYSGDSGSCSSDSSSSC